MEPMKNVVDRMRGRIEGYDKPRAFGLIQNEGDKVKVSVITISAEDTMDVLDHLFNSTVRAIGYVDAQKIPYVISGGRGVQSKRRKPRSP